MFTCRYDEYFGFRVGAKQGISPNPSSSLNRKLMWQVIWDSLVIHRLLYRIVKRDAQALGSAQKQVERTHWWAAKVRLTSYNA